MDAVSVLTKWICNNLNALNILPRKSLKNDLLAV